MKREVAKTIRVNLHSRQPLWSFPFAKLRKFIEYKAHEAGIEVRTVDEAYISQ